MPIVRFYSDQLKLLLPSVDLLKWLTGRILDLIVFCRTIFRLGYLMGVAKLRRPFYFFATPPNEITNLPLIF